MFEVIVTAEFSSAHALRHYHGATEPMHGHNFKVEVVVRGKTLQNKVKYLTDFVILQSALHEIVKPMDHTNLNDYEPFKAENPSSENIAMYVAIEMQKRWHEEGVVLYSVTVWETAASAARYYPATP